MYQSETRLRQCLAGTAFGGLRCTAPTPTLPSTLSGSTNLVEAVGVNQLPLRCECKWLKPRKRNYAAVNATWAALYEMQLRGLAPRHVSVVRAFLVASKLKNAIAGIQQMGNCTGFKWPLRKQCKSAHVCPNFGRSMHLPGQLRHCFNANDRKKHKA